MDWVLLLKRLCTSNHFLILHFLELQVYTLDHYLVGTAMNFEHLALTLLVATGNDLDLHNHPLKSQFKVETYLVTTDNVPLFQRYLFGPPSKRSQGHC